MPSRRRSPTSYRPFGPSYHRAKRSRFLNPPLAALAVSVLLIFVFGGLVRERQTAVEISPTRTPGVLAPFFSSTVHYWEDSIKIWAIDYGLDANLIATVMQIESCGDPQAASGAGANGLFQVMPFHFLEDEDPFDPQTNASRGLSYLRRAMNEAGDDVRLALAGYNGGIGVIGAGEASWAEETSRYVDWGAQIYADAINGLEESETLAEWLDHGGWRLCQQAAEKLDME